MCNIHKKCKVWVSLKEFGIHAEGCLRDPLWLQTVIIPCNQSVFNSALYIDTPTQKLQYIQNVAQGQFGYIDLAIFNTQSQQSEVYVKRSILSDNKLLSEACIQKLVCDSLRSIGFLTGAPHIISIFCLKDKSICFAMEQINKAITLDRYLESLSITRFSVVIIDCLFQLSAMIWHLNDILGINHRDLKPSNFLIVENDVPIRRVLCVVDEIIEIDSKYSLTLIDFGFSCLGSIKTHVSDISLSTVYSKLDPCPKEGRDMYLFLAFVYSEYYTKLPLQLLTLFEKWLDIPGSNLCSFMKKDKKNSKEWLYFMAGNENIKKFKSCPYRIIKDLQSFIES